SNGNCTTMPLITPVKFVGRLDNSCGGKAEVIEEKGFFVCILVWERPKQWGPVEVACKGESRPSNIYSRFINVLLRPGFTHKAFGVITVFAHHHNTIKLVVVAIL